MYELLVDTRLVLPLLLSSDGWWDAALNVWLSENAWPDIYALALSKYFLIHLTDPKDVILFIYFYLFIYLFIYLLFI